MGFIFIANTLQNGNGVLLGRFIDRNGLEPAFQRCVFFDVFAVFVQCGSANALDIAAGQLRLQNVGSVQSAFGRAGANQRMHFINEQNHILVGFYLVHNFFQPFFKIASVFGACYQRAHIQRDDFFIFQQLRHLAVYNTLRQPFGNGCFPNAWFAQQRRIIFGTAAQYLNHPFNFCITANHRVNLALPHHFI